MAKIARRGAGYADLLKVPDHLVAELIGAFDDGGAVPSRRQPAISAASNSLPTGFARCCAWHRLAGDRYELAGVFDEDEQPIVRAEPFDAIEFQLASLWPPDSADQRN